MTQVRDEFGIKLALRCMLCFGIEPDPWLKYQRYSLLGFEHIKEKVDQNSTNENDTTKYACVILSEIKDCYTKLFHAIDSIRN